MEKGNAIKTTDELTIGDVLKTTGGVTYAVRKMHFEPVRVGRGNQYRGTFQLVGFTLLETASVTDREVSTRELQAQLDAGAMDLYQPVVTRRLAWRRMLGEEWAVRKQATATRHGRTNHPADNTDGSVGPTAAG